MSIKRIKVKYPEFITSLSIIKDTIDTEFNMDSYWLDKSEMRLTFALLTRNSTSAYHYLLVFQAPSQMCIKELRVRYSELVTLLSIFQGIVDMN